MATLRPEQAARLLRAKAADLENQVLQDTADGIWTKHIELAADIALVAQLLADHIDHCCA